MYGCRLIGVVAVFVLAACTRQSVELGGRVCDASACIDGYACNPLTGLCAPAVDPGCASGVCAANLRDGDACTSTGSFVPCSGTSCDGSGCRVCTANNTWSACTCPTGSDDCECATAGCAPCVATGPEICDTVDNDCNGTVDDAAEGATNCTLFYRDADRDGFGAGTPTCVCLPPGSDWATNGDDPDDTNPNIKPDATELCNGIDDNGDGDAVAAARERDDDGDGYVECSPWVGSPGLQGGDCNDADDAIHPGANERCNGIADACGSVPANELDNDNDGYVSCSPWVGPASKQGGDCRDDIPRVNPGGNEILNGLDDDCDGVTDPCFDDCTDCGGSLVGCYPLDSFPPNDGSATANNGSTSGDQTNRLVTGRIGRAYDIDSSFTVSAPANAAQVSGAFQITAWVYLSSAPAGGTEGYIVDIQSSIIMAIQPDRTIRCSANGQNVVSDSDGPVPLNTWTHVSCRRGNGTGSTLRIYVDGNIYRQVPINAPGVGSTSGPMCIGSNSAGSGCSGSSIDGAIDHLQIFNNALPENYACRAAGRDSCDLVY